MATFDPSIINAALTRTGNDPIARLDDGSVGAAIASANYEDLVRAELGNYPWKRSSKIAVMNRLDPVVEGTPPEPWKAAYELPDDFVDIRTVTLSGYPINYEFHGDVILTNSSASDAVVLHYLWRIEEAEWPSWFRLGMIYRCEAMFLRGIGERYDEAADREKAAEIQFARARSRDSQSHPARNPVRSGLLAARGGMELSQQQGPPLTWPWRYG